MTASSSRLAALPMSAVVLVLFALTPAAPSAPLGAWPLTPAGTAFLAAAIAIGALAHRLGKGVATGSFVTAIAAMLIAARFAIALTAVDTGWRAFYFANDSWHGPAQWSSDYRFPDATRIDHELSFADGAFPVHFLNGYLFPSGDPRDVTEALSVEWRGTFELAGADTIRVDVAARGEAMVEIDGRAIVDDGARASGLVSLGAGEHTARVRYRKPVDTAGALSVVVHGEGGTLPIFPEGTTPRDQSLLGFAAAAIDLVAVMLLAIVTGQALAAAWRDTGRDSLMVKAGLVVVLGVQGFVTALGYARFRSLTGGDDWFGFESRARDILQHGLLMPLGSPIGQGEPYFYHPLYSYFLAAVHALTGESLFGPIFVNFIILAVTALVVGGLVSRLFGRTAGMISLAGLFALFEIDFIRYYTVTLLSENLYVLTVACCLACFARWAESGRTAWLAAAGWWGGVSSVTRPAMMVFFVPALAVTLLVARYRRWRSWPVAPMVVAAAWMIVVLSFTARNWIVSRQMVLISSGQERTVLVLNVPPQVDPRPYVALLESGQAGTAGALWRVFRDHPGAMLALQLRKLGFTLGMVHWNQPYRPHPELVAISVLYLLMLGLSETMRRAELWPLHAFVASHWASMALTTPWNYGYRLILPPFIFTTALSLAAASSWRPHLRLASRP